MSHKRLLQRQSVADSIRRQMALEKQEFARRLREAREHAGLSQEEAAKKIGVTLRSYGRWESTHKKDGAIPRGSRLDPIAEALNVDREYLMGPPPAPLGMGDNDSGPSARLAVIEAKLDLLLAAAGVSLDGLPDDDVELIAALEEKQRAAKPGRRRKSG